MSRPHGSTNHPMNNELAKAIAFNGAKFKLSEETQKKFDAWKLRWAKAPRKIVHGQPIVLPYAP